MGEEADTEKDKFLGLYFLIPNLLLPFNSCVIQAGCLISLSLVTTLLKCNIQFIRFFYYSLNDQFLILLRAAVYCQAETPPPLVIFIELFSSCFALYLYLITATFPWNPECWPQLQWSDSCSYRWGNHNGLCFIL